jgi:hypothetical protein
VTVAVLGETGLEVSLDAAIEHTVSLGRHGRYRVDALSVWSVMLSAIFRRFASPTAT